jgi:hypothetical protein
VSLERLLRVLAVELREAGVPFMLTGSVAAAFRGASRATMDIDLVIDPTASALDAVVGRIEASGLYVSPDAAREAFRDRGMFNVIDPETGWKGDLILRKDRPFSLAEFARREAADFAGVPLAVATLEDVILSKLEWARLGGSARQLEDVRALLRIAGTDVDTPYIESWIDPLSVRSQWNSVRAP